MSCQNQRKKCLNMKESGNWLKKWLSWKGKPITSIKRTIMSSILHRLMYRMKNAYMRWSLYLRCNELPLAHFITCICDGNVKLIRKRGFVSTKMLLKAWSGITEEYARLSGDTGYEKSFLLSKEIARENGKLTLIKVCLNILSIRYSKKCVDYLAKLGYDYKFPENDPESFRKDWDRVRKKVRMLDLELKEKRRQYEKLLSECSTHTSREAFSRSLAMLSKYMGFRINPEKVTVEEYVIMQKQYDKEMKNKALLQNSKAN